MSQASKELQFMQEGAQEAANLLKLIGNEHRLLVLCLLIEHKEMSVSELLQHLPLSQSSLSQHLAKMRHDELITYRRDTQTLYYRIQNPAVKKVISTLKKIYCP